MAILFEQEETERTRARKFAKFEVSEGGAAMSGLTGRFAPPCLNKGEAEKEIPPRMARNRRANHEGHEGHEGHEEHEEHEGVTREPRVLNFEF